MKEQKLEAAISFIRQLAARPADPTFSAHDLSGEDAWNMMLEAESFLKSLEKNEMNPPPLACDSPLRCMKCGSFLIGGLFE